MTAFVRGLGVMLVILFLVPGGLGAQENFTIKFGLMAEQDNGEWDVYKTTTMIPLITRQDDRNFAFGYTVYATGEETHTHYCILRLPQSEGASIQTEVVEFEKRFGVHFAFDESDRPGKWAFEIYIDDNLFEIIEIEVTPAG